MRELSRAQFFMTIVYLFSVHDVIWLNDDVTTLELTGMFARSVV